LNIFRFRFPSVWDQKTKYHASNPTFHEETNNTFLTELIIYNMQLNAIFTIGLKICWTVLFFSKNKLFSNINEVCPHTLGSPGEIAFRFFPCKFYPRLQKPHALKIYRVSVKVIRLSLLIRLKFYDISKYQSVLGFRT